MTKKEVTQLSFEITGHAIKVHRELGPGLLESVYEKCLTHELISAGYKIQNQIKVPIVYKDLELESDLRIDILVNNTILVELKAVETLHPVHSAQLLSYMKLLKKPQGLLINFHTDKLTKGVFPFVNQYFNILPD